MDYEKAYKEALGWMRSIYPTLRGADKEDVEHYFPELLESNDERIRKFLYDYFSGIGESWLYKNDVTCKQILAWLEKQKDITPIVVSNEDWDCQRAYSEGYQKGMAESNKQNPLTTEETELNSIAFLEQLGYTCIPPGAERKLTEWSEEDEKGFNGYSDEIIKWEDAHPDWDREVIRVTAYHFYPLRPQPHWKPSEKQMKHLERCFSHGHTSQLPNQHVL